MRQLVKTRLQQNWDLRAAVNFCFGGTGTGLIIASALATLAGGALSPLAALAGLVLIFCGLFSVWLEIGRPWRALNVVLNPRTSWMTREALLVVPLAAAVAAALLWDQRIFWVAAILAAGFLYAQARMLQACRGIPAWSQPELVPLMLATGLAEGTGLSIALDGTWTGMIAAALVAGVAREFARYNYRTGLAAAKAPVATLRWLDGSDERFIAYVRLAALVLLAAALAGWPTALAGGALSVLAGWAMKAGLITRAAHTRGHIIQHTPVRGRGPSHTVQPV